ncbi:hypothetical protein Taro_016398 [Colocasia esculenta]|uniref:Uncharacterized protein n=1 Tax=Colocasia esculenta TaxID=4460 RepID=A0A843UDQ6_COLES|nr:hypothetical protein [Colocasia esculenta]
MMESVRNERRQMEWRREEVERDSKPTDFQEEDDRRVDLEKKKRGFRVCYPAGRPLLDWCRHNSHIILLLVDWCRLVRGRFTNVLGSWEAKLGLQEKRRMAGKPSSSLIVLCCDLCDCLVLDLHKGEAEENEYTHEDEEDQE